MPLSNRLDALVPYFMEGFSGKGYIADAEKNRRLSEARGILGDFQKSGTGLSPLFTQQPKKPYAKTPELAPQFQGMQENFEKLAEPVASTTEPYKSEQSPIELFLANGGDKYLDIPEVVDMLNIAQKAFLARTKRTSENVLGQAVQQASDKYESKGPLRADLARGAVNAGLPGEGFKQLNSLASEIPTAIELGKENRMAEMTQLQKRAEARRQHNQALRDRQFIYKQRNDFGKKSAVLVETAASLNAIDNALVSLGIDGGIYGKPNEKLEKFAGLGAKSWRNWLDGKEFGELRTGLRQLIPTELRAVSGAAVTDSEAKRFMMMFNLKNRSSAQEFLLALQQFSQRKQDVLHQALAPLEASVREDVINGNRGFITPKHLPSAESPPQPPSGVIPIGNETAEQRKERLKRELMGK